MPEMFLSTGEETSQDRERCWGLAGAQLLQPIPSLGKVMRLVAAPPSTFPGPGLLRPSLPPDTGSVSPPLSSGLS